MRDALCSVEQGIARIDLGELAPISLSIEYCDALETALTKLVAIAECEVVLLDGSQGGLPLPSDLAKRVSAESAKRMSKLFSVIEGYSKPVVLAIDGPCTNEGLEFALAAHYRICDSASRFEFKQISVGSMPCCGGTQRLPRLAGAKTALDMLLNGRNLSASDALKAGLVDCVVDEDVLAHAYEFIADHVVASGTRPTHMLVSGKNDPLRYQQQMAEAKKAVSKFGLAAAVAIVDCVEAAQLLPIETGLALEWSLFEHCERSEETGALRYAAESEHRLMPTSRSASIDTVSVLGPSAFNAPLIVALLDAGLTVSVIPQAIEDSEALKSRVSEIYDRVVDKKRLPRESADRRLAKLRFDGSFPESQIAIDAGRFSADVIRVTTNSSPLVLSLRQGDDLAQFIESVSPTCSTIGVSFQKPAHIGRVAEVIASPSTPPEILDNAKAFIGQIGKLPVCVRNTFDPVTSVLQKALFDAAEMLVLHGAEPRLIDTTLTGFGFKNGPLILRDQIGLKVGFVQEDHPVTKTLLDAGRLGRATGLGFYRYAKEDMTPRPDGTIVWALSGLRGRLGVEINNFKPDEILKLCLGTLLNKAARVIADGIVECPSDIDVIAINNLDFPRRKGGLLKSCETLGLLEIGLCMKAHAHRAPQLWKTDPLVSDLIKNGTGFGQIDR